jgi:hypothetical protein
VAILLFLLAVFLAIRSLMALVLKRRDRLHELLVAHVKQFRIEQRKKMQILEFRRRKRKKKEQQSSNLKATESVEPPAKAA